MSIIGYQTIITEPPYEVRETGWGEFEAIIKIFFKDSSERHVSIYHTLKLFNPDPLIVSGKKLLRNEFYDEIVFQDPTVTMYNSLLSPVDQKPAKHDTDFDAKKEQTLKNIAAAKEEVKLEIKDLKDCLKESKALIAKFRAETSKAEQEMAPSFSTDA